MVYKNLVYRRDVVVARRKSLRRVFGARPIERVAVSQPLPPPPQKKKKKKKKKKQKKKKKKKNTSPLQLEKIA
jgi:hypothetical protein